VYRPRNAVILGIVFAVVGLVYWWVQHYGAPEIDYVGATLLVATGIAMGSMFVILLRGSGEL
jgi:hypothetical protein